MSLKDFEILSKLGSGSYSSVFKACRRADNRLYALKQVSISTLSPREKANAINEVRLLASVSHPQVVTFYDSFIDEKSGALCIVMEYADGGDLQERIRQCQVMKTSMAEEEIWEIFGQIVNGLSALHDMQILHRDIKSANVFLTSTQGAKLGDLNVAKVMQAGLNNTQTGTPYYASPEVWDDLPYDFKSDLWSLGCVLYEMAALKLPFIAKDMDSLYWKVVMGTYAPLPDMYSLDLAMMVKNLLQVNPTARPTSKRLLQLLTRSGRVHSVPHPPNLLLRTILFPKKIRDLKPVLPSPKYQRLTHTKGRKGESKDQSMSHRSESSKPKERGMSLMNRHMEAKLPQVFRLPSLRLSNDHTSFG